MPNKQAIERNYIYSETCLKRIRIRTEFLNLAFSHMLQLIDRLWIKLDKNKKEFPIHLSPNLRLGDFN